MDKPVPPPPPPSDEAAGVELREHHIFDTGRTRPKKPTAGELGFQIHGEYQLRFTGLSNIPLRPFSQDAATDSLGQTVRGYHWLRVTPRLQLGDKLELVGQVDIPYGYFAGEETRFVDTAEDPFNNRDALRIAPRWLYLQWTSPIGLFRVGQQPSYWGMGIIANDGDHPTLFGDYINGSIVERFLFATKPGGRDSKFNLALAGDIVFEDNNANLRDDEFAAQGIVAAVYRDKDPSPSTDPAVNSVGLYLVYRHQQQEAVALQDPRQVGVPIREFDETLDVFVVDSAGSLNVKVPGSRAHVFGAYEIAYLHGKTDIFRTIETTLNNRREDVRALGAAAKIGAVATRGSGEDRWGEFVASVEWGWASGDADPNDGEVTRFTIDANHNVGLILFDEILKWKTARAAANAQDPDLVNRPAPGVQLLPSDGGIFGATYVYPTFVYRPVPQLDLKTAVVIAQTSADFVDPVRVATDGRFLNYDGGTATSHDLGVELDAGIEYRLQVGHGLGVQLGAQGGVFFPGNAFNGVDLTGNPTSMGTQYLGVARLGLQY